ncbi:MAG: DUF3494 domain-containing protein [Massilia sp.]|nr:DUF3494 domain-containing protein [Massilia sp.]
MTLHLRCLKQALLLFIALACRPSEGLAAPVLGAQLSRFAVIGGSSVTSAGISTLTGSVGVSPGVSITGFGPGTATGGTHVNDPSASAAHTQLAAAMSNLKKMGGAISIGGNLDGLTLRPGVYNVAAASTNLTQTLTLDGGGNPTAYWVFNLPTTLITSVGSVVKVINAGAGAGVYWVVGSSATIAAGSTFLGNLLVTTSITMNEQASITCGRAMALDGAVTMISNTVNSADCAGTDVEGSAGLSGGLDVPDDGSAPTPLQKYGGGGDSCSLRFSVPNHVAETAQSFSITSVATSNTSCLAGQSKVVNFTCAYANPASGTVPLRMGANVALASSSAAPCSAGGANLTLNFNAGGLANATVMYADAGQMTLNASYLGCTGEANCLVGGASTFIVAPARLAFGAIRQSGAAGIANPAALNDQGAPFIKAGAAFSATLSALNQLGNPTANFGQEAAPEQIRLVTSLVAPLPGKPAALSGNFGAFSGGVASASNLAWGEVGIITLSAGLANDHGYLGTSAAPSNLTLTGSSGHIGRFVPDHFDTALSASGTMRCPPTLVCPAAGLTYAGKPFGVTLTARNTAGSTTENYAGAFARDVTLGAWSAPGARTLRNPPATPGGNQLNHNDMAAAAFRQGIASTTAPSYTFASAFPAITNLAAPTDIYVRAFDSEGVTSLRGGAVEGGIKVVSARFQVVNNYGSDVLALPVSVHAQFWDGTRFINSSTDQSSMFRRDDVMLNNCTRNLNSGTGCKTALALAPATFALTDGAAHFTLTAPGSGNTGSVDVRVSAAPYFPSTTARATFGLYKGGPIVFLRESY